MVQAKLVWNTRDTGLQQFAERWQSVRGGPAQPEHRDLR